MGAGIYCGAHDAIDFSHATPSTLCEPTCFCGGFYLAGIGVERGPIAGPLVRQLDPGVGRADRAGTGLPEPRVLAGRSLGRPMAIGSVVVWHCAGRGRLDRPDCPGFIAHSTTSSAQRTRLGKCQRWIAGQRGAGHLRAIQPAHGTAGHGLAFCDPSGGHRCQPQRSGGRPAVRTEHCGQLARHVCTGADLDPNHRHAG